MTRSAAGVDLSVAGLGPAGLDLLPPTTLEALLGARSLLLRTGRHPAAEELRARGVTFQTLDAEYEQAESFEGFYERLAEVVLARVRETAQAPPAAPGLVYAVPGHPLLGEESVRLLLQRAAKAGLTNRVYPAPGFVDVVSVALAEAGEIPDLTEWQVVDAAALTRLWWDPERPTLIFQVDDQAAASRVKLVLAGEYPDAHPVCLVRHAGEAGQSRVQKLPVYLLDRPAAGPLDHLCTLYVPPLHPSERLPDFRRFVEVVAQLRSPEGCPWDREQTFASLRRYTLEEAYEVVDAVESGDPDRLCEELGDLMLQVLLNSQIAEEEGAFDIREVIALHVEKLVRRHPHVFGDTTAATSDEVLQNWERIKQAEKPERQSALDGVPIALPALTRALEVSKRAVKVGFEWPDLPDLFATLEAEGAEFRAELPDGYQPGQVLPERVQVRLRQELGDLLFTLVNLARWIRVDPEEALREMVTRFSSRFREMEARAAAGNRTLAEMTMDEREELWVAAKEALG